MDNIQRHIVIQLLNMILHVVLKCILYDFWLFITEGLHLPFLVLDIANIVIYLINCSALFLE